MRFVRVDKQGLGRAARVAATALTCAFGLSAHAGAFLQPPGEGLVIVGTTFSDSVRSYDAYGRLIPVAPWRKFELSTYAEYGVTDWLTAVGDPSLFVFRQKPPGENRQATGVAEGGGRVRLVEWDSSILSAQATVRAPLAGASARPFVDTTRFAQVDARLLWGRGFEILGLRAFTDVEIGFRSNGWFGNEARVDATFGLWPLEQVLLLFQSFSAATPGRIGHSLFLSQKLQASGVYWVTPRIGLQIGGLAALRGVNASAEKGGFGALWYRF